MVSMTLIHPGYINVCTCIMHCAAKTVGYTKLTNEYICYLLCIIFVDDLMFVIIVIVFFLLFLLSVLLINKDVYSL